MTGTTATLGGNVTSDGGATITERGVVFAKTSDDPTPTLGEPNVTSATTSGTTGVFTVGVSGLAPGTAYSFAAYATNSAGTGTFTTLSNNADLTGITLSVGGLSPVFAANTLLYTASVSNSTGTLTFTPALSSGAASVTVNGASAATPVTLTVGSSNTVNITVTATDGTMKTYTVTVTRRTVFQDWALANGVSNDPSVAGANGAMNVQNFAFGLDPNGGATGALAYTGTFAGSGSIGANGLPITMLEPITNAVDFRALFIRRKDYVNAGLTYLVEFSATLGTWNASTAVPTVLADNGTYQIVSIPFPPLGGGENASFFHVRTTLAP